jgi:GR25 family glycosyltransferase involved in LPS biosynthesis
MGATYYRGIRVSTPVYLIHCTELPERTEAALGHLLKRRVNNLTLVRSIHGKTWGIETTREYDEGKRISPGHVGLLIGHWIAWQVAAAKAAAVAADNNTPALILEDDVILPEDWQQQLDEVEAELADCFPDWELCMVGHCESEPQVWHKVTERVGGPSSRICRINLPFGTHAYLVRPSAIPKLLDLLPQGGAVRNMDQQLFFNALQGNQIKWCAVLPALIRQRTFDYTRQGNPEWGPSTIDPNDEKEAAFGYRVTETEARSIVGNAEPPPRITPEALAATLKMVDPLPCIYRGETLDSHGLAEKKRTVTVSQCARLGVPCHSKPEKQVGKVRTADGDPVRVCESCELRTSMNPGGAKRTRLP